MTYVGCVTDKTLTPYILIKNLTQPNLYARFPFYEGWDSWDIEVISMEEWLANPDMTKFPLTLTNPTYEDSLPR